MGKVFHIVHKVICSICYMLPPHVYIGFVICSGNMYGQATDKFSDMWNYVF